MTSDSVMFTLTQFVDTLNIDKQFTRIEVLIDTKLYPNAFSGIKVRPIHITLWNNTNRKQIMVMQDIINKFNGICYVRVNETTHRRLSREPSMIVINTTPRMYNEHIYYDYRISKLFLLNELQRYNKIFDASREVMKKYKEKTETTVEQQGKELVE